MMNICKALVIPALTLLSLSLSPAFSAEKIESDVKIKPTTEGWDLKKNIKAIAKKGPGAGADEHGCIAPQIWHAASGTCVTDVLPNNGGSADGMQPE